MESKERSKQLGEDLLKAASNGDKAQLERCLNGGANINYQNWAVFKEDQTGPNMNGHSALHEAVLKGQTEIIRLLIKGGINLDLQNENGNSALHEAVKKGYTDIVRLLIDGGINLNIQNRFYRYTALHEAVLNSQTKICRLLIDAGINLNLRDVSGSTALHRVASNGRTEIARLLIDSGIDPNLQDVHGSTALFDATHNGHADLVYLLIENHADVNIQNKVGNTALHIAFRKSHRQIVECLLNKYCDPNILNNIGEKPIDVVGGHQDIIKILKEYGNSILPGLPAEVKKFDKKSAHVFSSLLKEESYPHYESRFMLAGEQGTGKTTLARYLVGKQPTRVRISTDGIELYNGLSFMDRESKEWLGGHQDFSLEEITVSRSLLKEKKLSKSVELDDTITSSQDVSVEAQTIAIPGSKRNLQHKPNDTLSSDTPSAWPEHESLLSN